MSATTLKQLDTTLDQRRDNRIAVMVTKLEKSKFEKMARERHTDISELIRQLLHREAEAQKA